MPENPQHMVRDGDLPIIYIVGKHLYKFFPDTGQVYLMKRTFGSEHGAMVGYASLTKQDAPVLLSAEFVLLPSKPAGYGYTDPQYKIRHYNPAEAGWVELAPPIQNIDYHLIEPNPSIPDHWLLANNVVSTLIGEAYLWQTTNAGEVWARIPLTGGSNVRIVDILWSHHAPNFVYVLGVSGQRNYIWYGNPLEGLTAKLWNTVPSTSRTNYFGSAVMTDGRLVIRGFSGGILGSTHLHWYGVMTPEGVMLVDKGIAKPAPGTMKLFHLPSTQKIVGLHSHGTEYDENTLRRTDPFTNGVFTDLGLLVPQNTLRARMLADGRIFVGADDQPYGVREILGAAGSPTLVTAYGDGMPAQAVAIDNQTRSVVAVMSFFNTNNRSARFMVYQNGVWSTIDASASVPDSWVSRRTSFAVITRPVA